MITVAEALKDIESWMRNQDWRSKDNSRLIENLDDARVLSKLARRRLAHNWGTGRPFTMTMTLTKEEMRRVYVKANERAINYHSKSEMLRKLILGDPNAER